MLDILKSRKTIYSNDVDDAYDALIEIGKCDYHQELIEDVKKFISHEEPDLQKASIMVLGYYWKIPDFEHELLEILNNNSDDDVRVAALTNWVGYYQRTKNKEIILKLNKLLRDSSEDLFIRVEALRSLGRVADIEIKDDVIRSLERAKSYDEMENLIPWSIVDSIVEPYI